MSLLWLAFIVFCVPLEAGCYDDQISWIYLDFPPVHIAEGPFTNQGYGDFVLQLLINNLEGYEHKRLKCNIARAQELLKNQAKVGHPAFLKKSDRNSYVAISVPAYVLIPNGVLVLNHQLHKLESFINKEGIFLLEKAITQSNLKVGISAERAYGGVIDRILTKHKGHQNLFINFDEKQFLQKLISMMAAGRIDCIVGYPNEGQYYAKQSENNIDITCLPVEGMPDFVLGYIAFPKNEWGKAIIQKINPILKTYRNTQQYHAAYEFWLDDNSIRRYRQYVRDVYGNQAE